MKTPAFKWDAKTQTLVGTIISLAGVCATAWFSASETSKMTEDDKVVMKNGSLLKRAKNGLKTHPKTIVTMLVTCASIIFTERISWKALGELGVAVAALGSQNDRLKAIISKIAETEEGKAAIEDAKEKLKDEKIIAFQKLDSCEPIMVQDVDTGVTFKTTKYKLCLAELEENRKLEPTEGARVAPIVTASEYLTKCGATADDLAGAIYPEQLYWGWTDDHPRQKGYAEAFLSSKCVAIYPTYPWDDDLGMYTIRHLIPTEDLDELYKIEDGHCAMCLYGRY